jgi:hypothetical protein
MRKQLSIITSANPNALVVMEFDKFDSPKEKEKQHPSEQ